MRIILRTKKGGWEGSGDLGPHPPPILSGRPPAGASSAPRRRSWPATEDSTARCCSPAAEGAATIPSGANSYSSVSVPVPPAYIATRLRRRKRSSLPGRLAHPSLRGPQRAEKRRSARRASQQLASKPALLPTPTPCKPYSRRPRLSATATRMLWPRQAPRFAIVVGRGVALLVFENETDGDRHRRRFPDERESVARWRLRAFYLSRATRCDSDCTLARCPPTPPSSTGGAFASSSTGGAFASSFRA